MKITFGELKPLLQAQRIFVGGQKLVCAHAFYRDDLSIEIPENLATEAYTTYWGRCGERLASLGAFSYTRTLLPALINVGRYTSIADRLQVLGDRHPLEWASASPVFYAHHSGVMATLAADSGRTNQFYPFAKTPRPITIGNDVWIGQNVTLAQGITIGDGAVIAANALVVKDANGNLLADGDSVTVVKDLKVKGSSSMLKIGTKVKNIRLVEGDHNIDCKIDGFGPMKLKSEFVKKN